MIVSFINRKLQRFFKKGDTRGIDAKHVRAIRAILFNLDTARKPQDMNIAGYDLHQLRGQYKGFWSVKVSGNWRVIFRFEDENAYDVDYLDYH